MTEKCTKFHLCPGQEDPEHVVGGLLVLLVRHRVTGPWGAPLPQLGEHLSLSTQTSSLQHFTLSLFMW